jgi:hypothetical protein
MNSAYEVLAPLRAVADHLERHELPAPVGITIRSYGRAVTVQLHQVGLHRVSGALLAWARTLADVTVEAWRSPAGDTVHLTVAGRLPSGLLIEVYDGVAFAPVAFLDLPADAKQDVELGVLHGWAAAEGVAA